MKKAYLIDVTLTTRIVCTEEELEDNLKLEELLRQALQEKLDNRELTENITFEREDEEMPYKEPETEDERIDRLAEKSRFLRDYKAKLQAKHEAQLVDAQVNTHGDEDNFMETINYTNTPLDGHRHVWTMVDGGGDAESGPITRTKCVKCGLTNTQFGM